jgi:hypothetical protein
MPYSCPEGPPYIEDEGVFALLVAGFALSRGCNRDSADRDSAPVRLFRP